MRRSYLLIAFVIVSFVYIINLWFTVSGFFLFFTSIFFLGWLIFFSKSFKPLNEINYYTCLSFVLVLFTVLSFSLEATDVNGLESIAMWVGRLLMFAGTLISTLYIFNIKSKSILGFLYRNKFVILIIFSFLIQLSLLRIIKVPDVDIYRITKYGPLNLLMGINPYVDSGGHYEYYTYGPASIFLFLPFDLIFKDPRYLLIVCNFLISFTLYKISKLSGHTGRECEMLALVYLFYPRYPNLLVSSSTDILIVGLLAFSLLSFAYKHFFRAGIALGLLVGVKVFFALPLIFFLKYRRFPFKSVAGGSFLTLLLFYFPFLIDNANALVNSTVFFFFTQKEIFFLQKGVVTLAAFVNRQWLYFPPSYIFPLVSLICLAILWMAIKRTKSFSNILVIISFVFLILMFLSQLALPGYYLVASSFLLFALAFIKKDEKIGM